MKTLRKVLLGSTLGLGIGLAPLVAHATPYAFASNDITGLTITDADGTPLTNVTSASTNVADAANWAGFASASNNAPGAVGTALNVPQATSGPGPFPGENTFAQALTSATGARADAFMSGGSASSGGVTVQNVAEGHGNVAGSSTANNSANITFTVVGTGQALALNFADAINLIASTAANVGESAVAAITNSFQITPSGSSSPIDTFAPGALNAVVSSQQGVPPTNSVTSSTTFTHTTPVLAPGVTYTLSFFSQAAENVNPTTGVPEPASLVLLGSGLLGLGMFRLRRR
jgi:hypothetical protein